MRLLQLNMWSGKLGTQIERLRDEVLPDFVCLQEAYLIGDRPGSVFKSPTAIFKTADYPYSVFAKHSSQRYMRELADFGNMVLSKHRFSKEYVAYTSGVPVVDIDTKDGRNYNIRNFIHVVVDYKGKELHLLNHHGYHDPDSKDGSNENTRQLQIIADYVGSLDGPVILTGDFNLHPRSKSLDPIHALLRNLPTEFKISTTRSVLAKRQEVIDYVFVSKNVRVNDFYASEMIVSDHKALVLDFDI